MIRPKRFLWRFLRLLVQVTRSALANRLGATAAEMAYNAMLSVLPAMLVLIAAVRSLPSATMAFIWIASLLPQVMPQVAMQLLEDGLIEASQAANRQIFSVGVVVTLWLASNFLMPVIRALDQAYAVPLEKRRPWWLNRLFAVGLFIGTVGMLVLASVVLGLGQAILNWGASQAGWDEAFIRVWRLLLWPVSLGLMVLALAFLYRMAPAQQPAMAPVWPGAVAGSLIWLLSALGFSFYVRYYGRYEVVYGSIGAVIVLLLWLYLSAFGVLLGGEVNAAIHQLRCQDDPNCSLPVLPALTPRSTEASQVLPAEALGAAPVSSEEREHD